MAEFLIMIAIIVVCVMIFGKADSKRALLNEVGLDLSQNNYESSKEKEFEKYCLKSMKVAINKYEIRGKNEKDFLNNLYDVLFTAVHGPIYEYHSSDDDYDYMPSYQEPKRYYLEVKSHYTDFAKTVVYKRREAIKNADAPVLMANCNFSDKKDLQTYVKRLWDKYQYPWPENWMKYDGL